MKGRKYILTGIGVAVAILILFLFDRIIPRNAPQEPQSIRVDTLFIRDTIKVTKPVYVTRKVVDSVLVPVTDTIELVMAKSDPKVDTEFVNIIILATKKNYPYLGEMDFQSIISWIYQIPADQRVIHHDSTVIK